MQPDQQQRIMGYFIEEAKDHLNTIEQGLLNLQSTIEDQEMVNEVFRAAHSVKGGAAMLGLNSIQRVSHRLEDFFKVLKETPVQIDQKLENLFLRVFDALQELLGQLQGPFGLTDDTAQTIVAGVEPTFAELEQHLSQLAGMPLELDVPVTSELDSDSELMTPALNEAMEHWFRTDVPLRLREMLQLFKHPETDSTVRQQLQELCRSLSSAGEQYQLTAWCHVVETARRAIAHPGNSYRILAPIVIKDIKLAQELVLAQREIEIAPGTQLQNLVPVAAASPTTIIQDDFADLLELDSLATDSLAEPVAIDLQFEDLVASDAIASDLGNLLAGDLLETNLDIHQGPEVGTAELNSLADLFEGEMPELGLTWQQEEVLGDSSARLAEPGLDDQDTSNDFADLLFEETITEVSSASFSDDLNDLFGDDLEDDSPTEPKTSSTDAALEDFADLLEISDSVPSEPTTNFELNLDEFAEPISSASASQVFDQDAEMLSDFGFGSTSDLQFEDPLEDLGNLFDGLNDGDLNVNSATPQTSNTEAWNDQDFAAILSDSDDLDLGDLDLSDLDLSDSAITDLPQPHEVVGSDSPSLDFDFDDFAIEPIDAPEGVEVLSNDASDESLSDLLGIDDLDTNNELLTESANPFDLDTSLDLDSILFDDLDNSPTTASTDDIAANDEAFNSDISLANDSNDQEVDPLVVPDPWGEESIDLTSLTSFDSVADANNLNLFDEAELSLEDVDLNDIAVEPSLTNDLATDLAQGVDGTTELDFSLPEIDSRDSESEVNLVESVSLEELPELSELEFADSSILDSSSLDSSILSDADADLGFDVTADFALADLTNGAAELPELNSLELHEESEAIADSSLTTDDLFELDLTDAIADSPSESADLESAEILTESLLFDLEVSETPALGDIAITSDDLGGLDDLLADDLFTASEANINLELDGANFVPEPFEPNTDLELDDSPTPISDVDVEPLISELSITDSITFEDLDDLLGDGLLGDGLLEDELPASSSSDTVEEFGDLENLLEEDANTFADLGDLLADESLSQENTSVSGFQELDDAQSLLINSTSALDNFSDLESLLATDALDEQADEVTAIASDSEFDDLNDLLKDAEERMGGSPTMKMGTGMTQMRRTPRPGRVFGEQTMRVPVKHLDNLSNLVGELVVNRNSLEQDQERLRQSLDNLLYQVQQLSDVGQRMQDLYERSLLESSLLASRQGHRHNSLMRSGESTVVELGTESSTGIEYDPLEMDRFTGFHSLSQEMIELIVRVRESSSDIEFIVDETEQVTRMFRQVTTQLQEGLTRSRMVPFAQTADRLPRAVRDISMKVGKQAELVVEGRETLIDKMILEQLYDPMTHLVNNAITHGVESPSIRAAAGKPAAGRITIRAFHQGNQTIISVSDDGAGIDVERVKAKAVEKGLLSRADAKTISRLDVYDILFHPGFSTKDQADDFSGRGVGMDVVRTSLSEIRGVINTDSNPGKGTTFTIRLPLTLSISKALCCISDRARMAFPMDGVEDMLDLPKDRIQTNAEGQPCIAWRDSILPIRPLAELLGYNRHLSRGNVYGGSQDDDMVFVVVLRSTGNFLALQVDQVMGEQEIVIKQLEGPVPKPVGVAGATVLGDGRIMPIADVLELIDLSMGRIRRDAGGSLWEQGGITAIPEAPAAKTEPMVLIVDDSITVRELLSMTFNKVGYRVEQARDGQEAWEKLRSGLPCDIVFCDIEMPRMDGLELLSRIQKDSNFKHLPIAMLTSRGADRHRQMAASLGASGYFTKPYLEEALLDAAQRMLKGERLLSS